MDRKTSIPLYFKIESLIRNKILNGQLEPGDKLPTESELTENFGVSQITIRKALSNLEGDGLIVRSRAKGTFVAETIPMSKKFVITNQVYNILEDADRYEVKNVDLKTMAIKGTRNARMVREFFNLKNEDQVCVVKRTRLLRGIPMYYIENILPPSIASHLTAKELREKHLLKILQEKIGLTLGRGEMFIEAVPADPDVADILKTQVFEPLILRQLCYWFPTGEPIEVVDAYMRPDSFRYKVDLDVKSLLGP
ncbi:MAG: GntR family transcriptional regulator [Pseudomonadota bacterium]